jgi:hypothetical protein
MHDLDKIAADFLAVVEAPRIDKTRQALAKLLPVYNEGSIYNKEFQDLKGIVDRSYDYAFEALVGTDYTTYWLPDKTTVSPRGEIRNALGVGIGIRSSISAAKKVAKLKINDPHLDAVKRFLAACVPIAQALEVIKTKVVKGRKPITDPALIAKRAAQLASKTIKTCACCFRAIAVLGGGLIADHGYTLPTQWQKTSSCPGRNFKPLEVSSDGLAYMVDLLKKRLVQIDKLLENPPDTLHKKSFSYKQLGDPVTRESPEWTTVLRQYMGGLASEKRQVHSQLDEYAHKLANWVPEINESIGDLISELRTLVT